MRKDLRLIRDVTMNANRLFAAYNSIVKMFGRMYRGKFNEEAKITPS